MSSLSSIDSILLWPLEPLNCQNIYFTLSLTPLHQVFHLWVKTGSKVQAGVLYFLSVLYTKALLVTSKDQKMNCVSISSGSHIVFWSEPLSFQICDCVGCAMEPRIFFLLLTEDEWTILLNHEWLILPLTIIIWGILGIFFYMFLVNICKTVPVTGGWKGQLVSRVSGLDLNWMKLCIQLQRYTKEIKLCQSYSILNSYPIKTPPIVMHYE